MMDSACDFDLLGESLPRFESLPLLLPFLNFPQFQIYADSLLPSVIYILFELLGGRSSQPFDWLPFREWGKMSERTLEGGASRVRVTSSDDSRVDRIACAGSPLLSRLF